MTSPVDERIPSPGDDIIPPPGDVQIPPPGVVKILPPRVLSPGLFEFHPLGFLTPFLRGFPPWGCYNYSPLVIRSEVRSSRPTLVLIYFWFTHGEHKKK